MSQELEQFEEQLNTDPHTADEVARRVKVIEKWYDYWTEDKVWHKIKDERPAVAKDLLEKRDKIDAEWHRYKLGRSSWQSVEKRIDDYGESWRKVSKGFPV